MIYHVVAMAKNRVIGKNNRLPWHFSADLKHFKQLTMGSTILMGRKTFESIGKPLPGRENFIVSRTPKENKDHVRFFNSFEGALKNICTENCYVIGGAEVFKETMNQIDGIYLTSIEESYEGDVFYPEIPPHFKEKSREKLQDNPKIEVIFYENTKKR